MGMGWGYHCSHYFTQKTARTLSEKSTVNNELSVESFAHSLYCHGKAVQGKFWCHLKVMAMKLCLPQKRRRVHCRKDAWSTVKMTCLVNYRQPEGWRHPGSYDKTTTVTDLMPVLAGQPSSFCQCPSTYFCEGCWVTISCVLVVPVSLLDFLTDLYWSTCLLLTHTSIALDTCHLPIQVGPREGCCTLFSRSDGRFQVAQNVRGIWQPLTHNFSGDLKMLLTFLSLFQFVSPNSRPDSSWYLGCTGALAFCRSATAAKSYVQYPCCCRELSNCLCGSRMLVVGTLQWHSDVEKLFPPHVCQVESLLFRLLRWFSVCWLPWWLLQWLGLWSGWSWSQGAFSTSQAPRLWCSIWHLEKCMMPAVGFGPPEFWRMGWGRVRSDGLNCPTTEKLETPQAYTFFGGLNSAPSQQRHLQLFHLLDHEGQRSDWTDRGGFWSWLRLQRTMRITCSRTWTLWVSLAPGETFLRILPLPAGAACRHVFINIPGHARSHRVQLYTWNYLGIRLLYQIIGIMITLFGAFEHFWTPMTPKISEVMLAARGTQNQQLVGFGAQMEILPLKEFH